MDRYSRWYRNQAAVYADRLAEWIDKHPRKSKSRDAVNQAYVMLSRRFEKDEHAWEAIRDVEEFAWDTPMAATRVIWKAIGSCAKDIKEQKS